MGAIARLFGETPRVKLLEALTRLNQLEVGRSDIAREAGLFRASTNRLISQLEAEGFLQRIEAGHRPQYRVNESSSKLQLVAYFQAALELVERNESESTVGVQTVADFRLAATRTNPGAVTVFERVGDGSSQWSETRAVTPSPAPVSG